MIGKRVTVLMLLLASCAAPLERAKSTAWAALGMTGTPPTVVLEASIGGCLASEKFGRCENGRYTSKDDVARFTLNTGQRLSDSAFVHELTHAAIYRLTGDIDAGHRSLAWALEAKGKEALWRDGW